IQCKDKNSKETSTTPHRTKTNLNTSEGGHEPIGQKMEVEVDTSLHGPNQHQQKEGKRMDEEGCFFVFVLHTDQASINQVS
ncbi:hypothetical protein XENOCAPTIV_012461, partial [Xenoophorus captivus]